MNNEQKWQEAKTYIDTLFNEGIITYDEWYFMILSLRKKLGLLTIQFCIDLVGFIT